MNSEQIEQSAKNIRIDRAAIDHARILADAEAALDKSREPWSAEIQPTIWRKIMKSPITKLSSAAAVIIAVAVGAAYFGTSIDGTSVLLAEVIQNVEQVNSAKWQEKRIFTCDGNEISFLCDGNEISFLNSDAIRYFSSKYGSREDMYNKEGLLLHQAYWLIQENVRIRVVPPMEQYERTELTETERGIWGQPGFRAIVDMLKAEKPTELGRKKVNGRETEGFEIAGSKIVGILPIQVDSGVARIWVDVETSLPIQYEAELLTSDKLVTSMTGGKPVQIAVTGYAPQWNKEIEPGIFEPNIPRDYTIMKSDSNVSFEGQNLQDITKWILENVGEFELISKSRQGVTIVLRKQFLADIAAFKLQGKRKDVRDFYKKLDIYFIGTGAASGGWYKVLSPQMTGHVFELSESSDVSTLVDRSRLTVRNGYKYIIAINDFGTAVLRPIQKYGEQHVDLSFSFFPYEKESIEIPGATQASVDIPMGVKIGPDEAVLIRCGEPKALILIKIKQE
jgi:hypothetical protein